VPYVEGSAQKRNEGSGDLKTGILITVLIYLFVLVIGVGSWLARREKKTKHQAVEGEFALGGRSLSTTVVAVTLAFSVLGTAHILGVFELSWTLGASAVWFSLAHVILLVVVCLSTGLWVRRLGVSTVPEILELLFGEKTRILVSCVMAGVVAGLLTVETQGLGILMATMTGWSIRQGAIAGGFIGILYVILAGMKEVGYLNVINAVVKYGGLILATIFLAMKLPGGNYESIKHYYIDGGHADFLSIFGTPQIMLTFALGTVIAVLFSQGISQMLLQPAMGARDENTIRKALWIAAPVNGMFGVFAVVIGLTARALPQFQILGPKVAATTMLITLLPTWLAALLLASFLTAVLSTFAMACLAPATLFSVDIYKRLYRPDATEAQIRKMTRIAIVVLGGVAIVVASSLPPILASVNWLFSWLVPVFWVVVFGLFWKRSASVAVTTLLTAWILNCAWSFTSLPSLVGLSQIPNAYITLGCTLVVGIVGNLMVQGKQAYFRSEEYQTRRGIVATAA
jgi:solute:Na+ symporter, SSS family